MRKDLTDLTVVMDRSGSMSAVKDDAEGGINTLIAKQADQPGECLLTLVQFDTEYDFVHTAKPIRTVPPYALHPRGSTALLDAVGRAVTETGERLSRTPEDQRPGLVVFVIITDGMENASKEFTKAQVKKMIEHQTEVYKWQFIFLGANQDAFAEARNMGMKMDGVANYKEEKTSGGILIGSENLTRMRGMVATGKEVVNAYTDEEIESVK